MPPPKRSKARATPEPSFTRRTLAVRRAVDILKLFTPAEPTLSLQVISDRLRLSPPTAHRVIQTLGDEPPARFAVEVANLGNPGDGSKFLADIVAYSPRR